MFGHGMMIGLIWHYPRRLWNILFLVLREEIISKTWALPKALTNFLKEPIPLEPKPAEETTLLVNGLGKVVLKKMPVTSLRHTITIIFTIHSFHFPGTRQV